MRLASSTAPGCDHGAEESRGPRSHVHPARHRLRRGLAAVVPVPPRAARCGWPRALLLDAITGLKNLEVRGLMCIPPATDSAEASRPWFRCLRELRDAVGLEHCSWMRSRG